MRSWHSLRTPLNHIIGYSEMLLEDIEEEARPASKEIGDDLRALVFTARELVKFIQNADLRDAQHEGQRREQADDHQRAIRKRRCTR